MKNIIKGSVVVFALLGLNACVSTSDIQVETTKSDKVDLKGYKTYQFIDGSGVAKDTSKKTLTRSEKTSAEIEEMINDELAKKGKVPVSSDPDFFVAYLGGADRNAVKMKLDKAGKEVMEKSPEAALVLMLVDADSGSIIWMSTAEAELKGGSSESLKKRIKYTVEKMLQGV